MEIKLCFLNKINFCNEETAMFSGFLRGFSFTFLRSFKQKIGKKWGWG
jgi:hypothetical protein